MNRLQSNPIGKLIAALLFLMLTFSLNVGIISLLFDLPYVGAEDWQETQAFERLIQERENALIQHILISALLEEKPGALSYVDRQRLEDSLGDILESMESSQTNFRYRITSPDGNTLLDTNLPKDESLKSAVNLVYYKSFSADPALYDLQQLCDGLLRLRDSEDGQEDTEMLANMGPGNLVISCGVPLTLTDGVEDEFFLLKSDYEQSSMASRLRITLVIAALSIGCLLFLLWTAGHKAGVEGIHLSWEERIYFDFYCTFVCFVLYLLVGSLMYVSDPMSYHLLVEKEYAELYVPVAATLLTATVTTLALTLRTLVVRCKAHTLIRSTLILRCLSWVWHRFLDLCCLPVRLVHALPIVWNVVLAFLGYFFLNFFLYYRADSSWLYFLLLLAVNAAVLLFLCRWAIFQRKLRKGSEVIAAGNLDYQIEADQMPHELKVTAENLNNISLGMSEAVNERMKSERFKAELITNVSHDLKTPLTSIINYVNLLKTTQQTDPKAQEYIEVLDRKSMRLKKLTEDLVEASKASTGTLSINREKISMGQLIDQALGEWMEKLEARSLSVITSLPEGEVWVYADGRHLWRVIDNLLSNCAKYALEGTRVYLDLTRGHGQVIFSVKNVSRLPLNIPPERLMERFVRGDASRTTEGSGLGLSIARSLTELQDGTFELAVDGDLFKAIVTLPQAN